MVQRAGSKRLLRDLNQSIVLNLILDQQPISRTELARRSGLPAATITSIIADFMLAGLVLEVASEESKGGRRPVLLGINPDAGHVVGVKLSRESVIVTVCDLSCTILHSRTTRLTSGTALSTVVATIVESVGQCIHEARITDPHLLGVGVGLPGIIDSRRGICRYSALLGWRNAELAAALEAALHLPVRIDNDVNTLAVAEHYSGENHDISDFLLVTIGSGIGLGIVVGGEIYRGASGAAGEFGHMTMDTSPTAPICNCGKRGCLEAIASSYGLVQAAGYDIACGQSVEELLNALIERARSGDSQAQAIFTYAGRMLGIAIANMVNLLDPARILIGGEGLQAGDLLLEPLRAILPQHIFGSPRGEIPLLLCTTDDAGWARGAASLILREVFQLPLHENKEALVIGDLLVRGGEPQRRR